MLYTTATGLSGEYGTYLREVNNNSCIHSFRQNYLNLLLILENTQFDDVIPRKYRAHSGKLLVL